MSDILNLLIVFMLAGSGVYALYSGIRLRKECFLFDNKFLYPGNCPPAACTDVSGFISFIFPRIIIFGCICLAFGGAAAFVLYGIPSMGYVLPTWADLCMIPVMLLPYVWYCILQAKAARLFW